VIIVARRLRGRCVLSTLVIAIAAATLPLAADAQNVCTVNGIGGTPCSTSRDLQGTVRFHVRLTVTPTLQPLGVPTADDYNNGFSIHAAAAIEVKANEPWEVSVRSNNGQWTESGAGARPNKPRTDLEWGPSASGPWTTMTNALGVFDTGGPTDGEFATLYFRILWSWTLDTPGTYTINVLINLTAP
jgi:hypothetical protein